MTAADDRLASFACAYAERGWPVVPLWGLRDVAGVLSCRCGHDCHSPGKHPHRMVGAGGFKHATTDRAQAAEWWEQDGSANIGLRCGDAFDVLDVDHTDIVEGVAGLAPCETAGGPVVRTGSGKWHLYFAPAGYGRRIRFAQHCDWLGAGGYVVAPPSRHAAGGRYEWFAPFELSLTAAPFWLRQMLAPPAPSSPPVVPPTGRQAGRRGWSPAGLFGKMATAVEGERNAVLHWCAARIGSDVRAGKVDDAAATAALEQLATLAGQVGLGRIEIDRTIRSGVGH